jgi:putative ABC transport system permease protein
MQQFLEAANIALQAIWSNKLRSLLTVIGNVVAVTSIIAVVSLVQGLNASVKDAIQSQVGADSFAVTRNPVTFTQTQEQRAASNPRITLDDAEAPPRLRRAHQDGHGRGPATAARPNTARKRLDSIRHSRCHQGIHVAVDDPHRAWTADYATEFEDGRPVAVVGWGTADRLFGVIDPLDKTITLAGIHFKVVGVAEKKGAILGQSQDEFAIVPLAAYQKIFGMRQSLQTDRHANRSDGDESRHGRRDRGDADSAETSAGGQGQLRRRLVGHVPRPL